MVMAIYLGEAEYHSEPVSHGEAVYHGKIAYHAEDTYKAKMACHDEADCNDLEKEEAGGPERKVHLQFPSDDNPVQGRTHTS